MSSNINNSKNIVIGVSARHVHLSRKHVDELFGKGYNLKKYKDLKQTGQFAAEEKVSIITEGGEKKNVRVLGPVRGATQVEISKSDARRLKLNPPVRNSGKLDDSPGVILEGPSGTVELDQGCIIATRHIHMTPENAEIMQVEDGDLVSVLVDGEKGGVMNNVSVKVNASYVLEMHIDVDDANAFLLDTGHNVKLINSEKSIKS